MKRQAETETVAQPRAILSLTGMTCASCAARIEKALTLVPGVSKAAVNLATAEAQVQFDPTQVNSGDLVEAVASAGYGAKVASVEDRSAGRRVGGAQAPEKITFDITGMHCASCVANVEGALKQVPGVRAASVNLATRQAYVESADGQAPVPALIRAVEEAGYGASVVVPSRRRQERAREAEEARRAEAKTLYRDLTVALVFGIPVAIISMLMLQFPYVNQLLLALTLPVWAYAGRRYHRNALRLARHLSANMDTLVSLGTTAAVLWSLVALLTGKLNQIYFDSAAVIIALVLLGKVLESRATRQASDAIRSLIELQPSTARVQRDGNPVEVPTEEVQVGDVLVVRPGERIPVDGVLVEGGTAVNESMLTGESLPLEKQPGSEVFAGTINGTGAFHYRATRVGEETTLAEIVRVVEAAQGSKAPIQRLADQVASVFVPVVILIASLTFAGHLLGGRDWSVATINAVAVLVIACPCAMGLATPTAIMVGTGKGAAIGVLIRGGDSLEKVRNLTTVVFDKTGTLTKGQPTVTDVLAFEDWKVEAVLAVAAALEESSEHPLGQAIIRAARDRELSPDKGGLGDFSYVPGRGVTARRNRGKLLLGNRALMAENGIPLSGSEASLTELESDGKTGVLLADAGRVVGLLGIWDPPKPEAAQVVESLRGSGLRVAMMTGDARLTAQAVGRVVGINEVVAEVLPQQKLDSIAQFQKQGQVVAMVGDGINDAPALAQADLGIALGSGSAAALDNADIALLGDDLRGVLRALELSRRTVRTIKQNLFWAFVYNAVGIPLAALGWLNPMIAAAAMAFSSVFVVSNSLRLRGFKSSV